MSKRDSNIELLRIFAILLVLLLHADFYALDGPTCNLIKTDTFDSCLKIFFQALSIPAVNVFVMISGWYGIRPSCKGVANLMFQTAFYLILIYCISLILGGAIDIKGILDLFVATPSNWFIKAYILLYILSPVMNSFVEHASKESFKLTLLAFFAFQSIYGWVFVKSTTYFCGGYSPVSFIGLYLLARYVRIYQPSISQLRVRSYIIILTSILIVSTAICVVPSFWLSVVYGYNLLTYISPTTILSALLIVLLFSKLNSNSKTINRLAMSSFAVYLVYVNPNILSHYGVLFKKLYAFYPGITYWLITLGIVILLYLIVSVVDSIRIYIWKKVILNRIE